jgi:hypothetical protein
MLNLVGKSAIALCRSDIIHHKKKYLSNWKFKARSGIRHLPGGSFLLTAMRRREHSASSLAIVFTLSRCCWETDSKLFRWYSHSASHISKSLFKIWFSCCRVTLSFSTPSSFTWHNNDPHTHQLAYSQTVYAMHWNSRQNGQIASCGFNDLGFFVPSFSITEHHTCFLLLLYLRNCTYRFGNSEVHRDGVLGNLQTADFHLQKSLCLWNGSKFSCSLL